MKKRTIKPHDTSVVATFFEPVYQRLRHWNHGNALDLFCFVHKTNENVRQVLSAFGALPSHRLTANCFAEIWEAPHAHLIAQMHSSQAPDIDKQISEALGCFHGKCSSAVGHLTWGDAGEGIRQSRFVSKLLEESLPTKNFRR